MDLAGLRAECLSALARGLDGDLGGGAGDAASTDDASGVTSIDAASTATSADAASDVAVFGVFVVAQLADFTVVVDSTVEVDSTAVVVDTDKR
jgi:predicted secreted protein